ARPPPCHVLAGRATCRNSSRLAPRVPRNLKAEPSPGGPAPGRAGPGLPGERLPERGRRDSPVKGRAAIAPATPSGALTCEGQPRTLRGATRRPGLPPHCRIATGNSATRGAGSAEPESGTASWRRSTPTRAGPGLPSETLPGGAAEAHRSRGAQRSAQRTPKGALDL